MIHDFSKDVTGRAGCTVRALANVTGMTLEMAMMLAVSAGRRKGRRFSSRKLIEHVKSLGLSFRKVRMKPRTLARFLREHPVGRYYVRQATHAFAVVGASVPTGTSLHSRIVAAWEYRGVVMGGTA